MNNQYSISSRHIIRLGLAFGVAWGFTSVSFSSSKDTYYINDHIATTVAISDAAGEIAQIESDAFGAQQVALPKDTRFTGKPYDADIGAYVFPFRNYRHGEARWMSADPSGFPDGGNARVYACRPTADIDKFGLWRSGAFSSIFYAEDVSESDASTLEARLLVLSNHGFSSMIGELRHDYNHLDVVWNQNGWASGHQDASSSSSVGWSGILALTFSAANYANFSQDDHPEEFANSPLVTLAHELSHAIYATPDPTDLTVNYSGPILTAVAYENTARYAFGFSARQYYHYEPNNSGRRAKLNTAGYWVE